MSTLASEVIFTARSGPDTPEEWLGAGAVMVTLAVTFWLLYLWWNWFLRRDAEAEYARLVAESAEFARRWPDRQLPHLPVGELAKELERYWLLSLLVTDIGAAKRARSVPPVNLVDIQGRVSVLISAMKNAAGH